MHRIDHDDPNLFDAYCLWAREEAVPFLKANMDLVGFWVDSGEKPEYWGVDPTPSQHGAANVTWIIRWDSMEHRNQGHKEVFGSETFQEIWSNHPDPNGYLHAEITFTEQF